jgi:alpha-1,3-mannosyltransferase
LSQPVRILSITPAFAPQVGGVEQVVQELALRLGALGHHVEVAHVSPSHRGLSRDEVSGLTVHRVPLIGHRLAGWAPALGKLAQGFDLLHVHDPQLMAITANVVLQCAKIPAVLSTHGGFRHSQNLSLFKTVFERVALRRALRHYRKVLASSVGDFEYFSHYSAKVVLCANGVNTDKFGVVPRNEHKRPEQWIYWGRLSLNKRVDRLIESVALARQSGVDVDLMICGRDFDGIAHTLQQQVERLGLTQAVHFESHLSDAQLLDELSRRAVYITASEHEGFGLSIVEAMAAGLLVVCRDISPLNTFVQSGQSGHFLQFDNSAQDADTLAALLNRDPASVLAGGDTARATAQQYNWDTAAKLFEHQFTHALQT